MELQIKQLNLSKILMELVVGSEICKEITRSLNNRQNPVTNVSKIVSRLKNKIL